MLIRFIIKNFLSIGEELEFNLIPYGKIKRHKAHIYNAENIKVLKSAAIYGANGSGKSNFIKAVHLLHDIAINQNITPSKLTNICFKLDENMSCLPTTLEVEFEKEDNVYGYGVDILDGTILEEWLIRISPKDSSERVLFNRKLSKEDKTEIKVDEEYLKSERDQLLIEVYQNEILRKNQSLLYVLQKNEKFEEFRKVYEWFLKDLYIMPPDAKFINLIDRILKDDDFFEFTNKIVSKMDTGIKRVKIEEVPFEVFFGENDDEVKAKIRKDFKDGKEAIRLRFNKGLALAVKNEEDEIIVKKLVTEHLSNDGSNQQFELNEESDGTLRILDLIPALELALLKDKVFFIDEIGRSLHPSLLKEFVRYFLNEEAQGQFIFTTHESHLLDLELFRQDEIWFVEKDGKGNTKMYPLSDYQPRYDLNIRKGYLNGRFGAIPFLADFSQLTEYATQE